MSLFCFVHLGNYIHESLHLLWNISLDTQQHYTRFCNEIWLFLAACCDLLMLRFWLYQATLLVLMDALYLMYPFSHVSGKRYRAPDSNSTLFSLGTSAYDDKSEEQFRAFIWVIFSIKPTLRVYTQFPDSVHFCGALISMSPFTK